MMKTDSTNRMLLACLFLLLTAAPLGAEEKEEGEGEAPPPPVGFELGAFVMKDYRPLQDVTTRMIFTAHASVQQENAEEFSRLLAARRYRVRDQVLTAARLASPLELQDPELKSLRRRIQLRLLHSLPELAIEKVFFSEFQLYHD